MGKWRPQAGAEFRPLHSAARWGAAQKHTGAAAVRTKELKALLWAAAITAGEVAARKRSASRSGAWLIAYSLLGAAALIEGAPGRRQQGGWPAMVAGLALAAAGYPAGNALLRHKPSGPPPEELSIELLALAGVVAPIEELTWGGLVEPRLGIPATALLFAAKHVVADGRWRRAAGLALFWTGLGLVRRRSPKLALGLHVAANASGVLLGHRTGEDYF